jgi:hypothetical protein
METGVRGDIMEKNPVKAGVIQQPNGVQVIEIPVMGQKVVLKTSADPVFVEEVTSLVLDRLAVAEKRVKNANAPHLAAILALFDLAEAYIEAKKKVGAHQEESLRKMDEIRSWVVAETKTS